MCWGAAALEKNGATTSKNKTVTTRCPNTRWPKNLHVSDIKKPSGLQWARSAKNTPGTLLTSNALSGTCHPTALRLCEGRGSSADGANPRPSKTPGVPHDPSNLSWKFGQAGRYNGRSESWEEAARRTRAARGTHPCRISRHERGDQVGILESWRPTRGPPNAPLCACYRPVISVCWK